MVATAHPAKFREIVEPLIGREVPVPETLARLVRAADRVHGDRRRTWARCVPLLRVAERVDCGRAGAIFRPPPGR